MIGEIVLTKSDLDQAVEGADTALHGTASIEGVVYDLYAAEDIQHPDGVSWVWWIIPRSWTPTATRSGTPPC